MFNNGVVILPKVMPFPQRVRCQPMRCSAKSSSQRRCCVFGCGVVESALSYRG
ncbi:hypothetical protein KCP73_24425 [Salmonella enterica subsp. enterica]|nr:hypothetical protein KCP73_24425 [Salmonella enterica subsp. enterica]